MSTHNTNERKAMLTQVCDAENYLPIITGCLDADQVKLLKPRHMANFMSLAAELFITNYSMIGTAFERNNGLEIGFKARLAPEKDNVEISFKPVDVFKDSASANLPDEDQAEFPFASKTNGKPAAGPVVDAEVLQLPAPADTLALPEPAAGAVRTEDEEKAYQEGRSEYGEDVSVHDWNPYDETNAGTRPLHAAYMQGWMSKRADTTIDLLLAIPARPASKRKKAVEVLIEQNGEVALLDVWKAMQERTDIDADLCALVARFCREIDPQGNY